jgi:glycosyltransferase involved in cell wall biosynthesis
VDGRKIVYCHAPARWLYQTSRYVGGKGGVASVAAALLRRPLVSWDNRAAATASRYVVNSTAVRDRVRDLYAIDAEVLAPPPAVEPEGPAEPVPGVEPGFVLCVSRLLPYKNVDAIAQAFESLPHQRLVVVGSGPERDRLVASAGANVAFLEGVSDAQLRWLYASSRGLVAASYEDFGLTPLEAAAFGKPTAALRWGGFLDTVVADETGVFFDEPSPPAIEAAVRRLVDIDWDEVRLRAQADAFSEERFVRRLRAIVAEERDAA